MWHLSMCFVKDFCANWRLLTGGRTTTVEVEGDPGNSVSFVNTWPTLQNHLALYISDSKRWFIDAVDWWCTDSANWCDLRFFFLHQQIVSSRVKQTLPVLILWLTVFIIFLFYETCYALISYCSRSDYSPWWQGKEILLIRNQWL